MSKDKKDASTAPMFVVGWRMRSPNRGDFSTLKEALEVARDMARNQGAPTGMEAYVARIVVLVKPSMDIIEIPIAWMDGEDIPDPPVTP